MSFFNFPKELRDLKQWVLWKLTTKTDGKTTKVPYRIDGRLASSTDSTTWSTFDECVLLSDSYDGVGFVFTEGVVGIDLDKCILEDGTLTEEARHIVEIFPTYTEKSPSGKGLHIILKSDAELRGRKKDSIECYTNGRFFTVTGDVFEGREELRDLDILDWYKETFPEDPERPQAFSLSTQEPTETKLPDDEKILTVMFKSKNGGKMRNLYQTGDWGKEGYDSQSNADLALCSSLMFFCGNNKERVEALFRKSALMRTKWDEQHGNETYGAMTLRKAFRDETMQWEKKSAIKYMMSGGENPRPLLILENICRIFEVDSNLYTKFRLNDFSHMVESKHESTWRNMQDYDVLETQRYISNNYPAFARISKEMTVDAIRYTASQNKINPPQDYLLSLTWDGKPRLNTWLMKTYGVPDEEVYEKIGSNWLKGLVKRVLHPGCQFDEVLVLESPQGYRKSTSLRVLGQPWHVESTLSTDDKDFYMMLASNIIVEFSEGEIVGRTSARKLKAIITKTEDSIRPPYEHGVLTFKRSCVFAMTTNDSDYQKDDTGGRRWLPVVLQKIADIDWLEENREQLYAEAVFRVERRKETTHEYPQERLQEMQREKQEGDEYDEPVQLWYSKLPLDRVEAGITVLDMYHDLIDDREGAILTTNMQWRLGSILRRMGLEKKNFRCGRAVQKRWVKSSKPPQA